MLSYLPRQHTYLAWVLKGNGCWLNPLFDQLYLLPRIFSALHPSKSLNSLAQLLTTYVFLLVPALACRLPLSPQTSAQPGKKRREYMEAEALWLETETPCYLVGKITVAGPGVFSRQWSVSAAWQTHIPPEILSFVFFFPLLHRSKFCMSSAVLNWSALFCMLTNGFQVGPGQHVMFPALWSSVHADGIPAPGLTAWVLLLNQPP